MRMTKQMIMSRGKILFGTALISRTAQKNLWAPAVRQNPKIKKALDRVNL